MNRVDAVRWGISVALLGFFASSAMALNQVPQDVIGDHLFNAFDADHDGYLARSEVPETMKDLRMHFAQYSFDHRMSKGAYMQYLQSQVSKPCGSFPGGDCFEGSGPPKRMGSGISYVPTRPVVQARPRSVNPSARP